jgi:beta-N-acetylhexosaminidase
MQRERKCAEFNREENPFQMNKRLSLRQKVGQLMVIGFRGTEPSQEILRFIREDYVGGIILFSRNVGTIHEVLWLTTQLQKTAYESGHPLPLLICADQENGLVRRLGTDATLFPGNMTLGATDSEKLTWRVCRASGLELTKLGINMNLAPVLDINNNPKNPVIGVRSFGEDPERVSALGVAAIRGYQSSGVITCAKHFPGHGDTHLDSHLTLPTIPHDRFRLESVEFVPFKAAIQNGVDSIMIAHVCFPAIEPNPGVPATISHRVVTGLLRKELGFDGVITTDCLEMIAISETIGVAEGALAALKAGVDLIMVSHSHAWQREAIDRIVRAVKTGELSEARIDQSLARIQKMKQRYLQWETMLPLFAAEELEVPDEVKCFDHVKLSEEVAVRGVTVVKASQLPFRPYRQQKVLVVCPRNQNWMMVEDRMYENNPLAQAVEKVVSNVMAIEISNPPNDSDFQLALELAEQADYIVIGTLEASRIKQQAKLVKRLWATGKPLAVIAIRGPYDIMAFPEVENYLVTYEFTPVCVEAAAAALFGRKNTMGRLPVTIPGLFKRGWRVDLR